MTMSAATGRRFCTARSQSSPAAAHWAHWRGSPAVARSVHDAATKLSHAHRAFDRAPCQAQGIVSTMVSGPGGEQHCRILSVAVRSATGRNSSDCVENSWPQGICEKPHHVLRVRCPPCSFIQDRTDGGLLGQAVLLRPDPHCRGEGAHQTFSWMQFRQGGNAWPAARHKK